eukprot:g8658.t1
MEGVLECNKCKKILGGNCFLTKCRHILCHADGLNGYNDDGTFTCPICDMVLHQENGITELNFQGERISKSDINIVLSFLVERPGSSLDFLGQVIKFREFQRQELLKHQNLMHRNHSHNVKELERLNVQYRDYIGKMENKLNVVEKTVDNLQTEKKELSRKYEALSRSYKQLLSEQHASSERSSFSSLTVPGGGRGLTICVPSAVVA